MNALVVRARGGIRYASCRMPSKLWVFTAEMARILQNGCGPPLPSASKSHNLVSSLTPPSFEAKARRNAPFRITGVVWGSLRSLL